jgi:hypothetical protein
MRVALVHDWLTGMRGGEKVLEALCELFPDAELFTLVHVGPGTVPGDRADADPHLVLQRLPRHRRGTTGTTCRSSRWRSSSSTSTRTTW